MKRPGGWSLSVRSTAGVPVAMQSRESGFSLVAAIFLIVVLASLATFMVTISAVQQKTTLFALQSARAERAVRSGVEWALYQVLDAAGNMPAACGAAPSKPTVNMLALNAPGLNGFTVAVTCSYTQHQQGPDNFNVFAIDAVARYGAFGQPDYASRTLQVTATDLF